MYEFAASFRIGFDIDPVAKCIPFSARFVTRASDVCCKLCEARNVNVNRQIESKYYYVAPIGPMSPNANICPRLL